MYLLLHMYPSQGQIAMGGLFPVQPKAGLWISFAPSGF